MISTTFLPRTPGQAAAARGVSPPSVHDAPPALVPGLNGFGTHPEAAPPDTPYDAHLFIEVEDWDVLFEAVKTTLRRIVGERLGELPEVPEVPGHSATLAASLVQAVVLDCARSLDRLHAALKQERGQH
ncbi:MAG: hypothetical protein Q8M93_12325 [Polaromonas sp.]|uniref:hypothetical protein n=1 Tax=Comamonadaceae TaxID=80864 RepID=UPI002730A1C0|nr:MULTISPECIES: hypothetical protein [Comamonadaceae]MDP2441794.1 hypothetical protein [Rhodoferax sp.]MDP3247741.1 hypothetical protein [Polaromonas sp.]MDP3756891.1 hypothetical protein [Polaromonas sp.]MDP3829398.1 hypothetical protein [Polaromonas sp.]